MITANIEGLPGKSRMSMAGSPEKAAGTCVKSDTGHAKANDMRPRPGTGIMPNVMFIRELSK